MCIVLATTPLEWLFVILQVGLGLGAVIFVHELGHFAVAKMCGVKCDKFFIGFDVGGYKISRQWGETEYGIGILPLGGYVKMLGQDDNPANIAEQVRESEVRGESNLATKEITGPDGEKFVVDRRSYLAKTVPQRMAIISAGVIMNVLFAVIFASIAFRLGVPIIPSIVSQVAPGSAAYQAGIRTGDEITAIGDTQNPSFMELRSSVTLGDLENGIPFTIRRAGTDQEETVTLRPKQETGLAKVGIFSPSSLRMSQEKAVSEDTPAANASAKFQSGDEVIAVGGNPIATFRQWTAYLVQHANQPLEVTVRRGGTAPKDDRFGRREGGEEVTITVPARPMRRLGLAMEMGKIVAVQQGSPAAAKGLQAGDFIDKVSFADDSPANSDLAAALAKSSFSDPIALPEQLRRMAEDNRTIRLSVRRSASSSDGRQERRDRSAAPQSHLDRAVVDRWRSALGPRARPRLPRPQPRTRCPAQQPRRPSRFASRRRDHQGRIYFAQGRKRKARSDRVRQTEPTKLAGIRRTIATPAHQYQAETQLQTGRRDRDRHTHACCYR